MQFLEKNSIPISIPYLTISFHICMNAVFDQNTEWIVFKRINSLLKITIIVRLFLKVRYSQHYRNFVVRSFSKVNIILLIWRVNNDDNNNTELKKLFPQHKNSHKKCFLPLEDGNNRCPDLLRTIYAIMIEPLKIRKIWYYYILMVSYGMEVTILFGFVS